MKKRYETKKKAHSDKIEINRGKVYSITDPIQLAYIFFPQRTANKRRAAFLAILFEIRNAEKQHLYSMIHIADKYGLPASTIFKVRAKMTRLGIIRKHQSYWMFSSYFKNTLIKLIEILEIYQPPADPITQKRGEIIYISIAKELESQWSR